MFLRTQAAMASMTSKPNGLDLSKVSKELNSAHTKVSQNAGFHRPLTVCAMKYEYRTQKGKRNLTVNA